MIDFTTLFERLGRIGCLFNEINYQQANPLISYVDLLAAQFDGERDLVDNLYANFVQQQQNMLGMPNYLRQLAQNVVVDMVNLDNPLPDRTLVSAMTELIRQMKEDNQAVAANALSASITPDAANNADPNIVLSLQDVSGQELQNVLAESIFLRVTTDSESGSAVLGRESLQALGEASLANVLDYKWPTGSGGSATLTAIDATADNAAGNILTNSDFTSFGDTAPNQADNWIYEVGDSQITAFGAGILIQGDGSTPTYISQTFDDSIGGTSGTIAPLTQYAWSLWLYNIGDPIVTGTLTVALVDVMGSPIENCSHDIDLTTLTGREAFGGVFQTPRVMPPSPKFVIYLRPGGMTNLASLWVSSMALGKPTQLYRGGPSLAVFSAGDTMVKDDNWSIDISNDRNSAWSTLFERLFGMNQMGLQLPVASVTNVTVEDSTMCA